MPKTDIKDDKMIALGLEVLIDAMWISAPRVGDIMRIQEEEQNIISSFIVDRVEWYQMKKEPRHSSPQVTVHVRRA